MIITKEAILDKTHCGTNIYAHILRSYYPDEVVMRIVGRDCGLCRNPFNNNKPTLHIFIIKENVLHNAFDKEHARHEDTENVIPTGDAFDFAKLHYHQQGDELLQTLNREMFLHIGEQRDFYRHNRKAVMCPKSSISPISNEEKSPLALFSLFLAPISNTKPHKAVSLLDAYHYIVGDYAKERTQKYRAMLVEPQRATAQIRQFKAANFDYCTFSGTFSTRSDKALIQHSGLLCVDFDHLTDVSALFQCLLKDEYFDTQLLFRSPSGDGLKWIIPIDTTTATHADFFRAVAAYIQQTYTVEADKSGRDISRACFLPHDPQAFINPIYLKNL